MSLSHGPRPSGFSTGAPDMFGNIVGMGHPMQDEYSEITSGIISDADFDAYLSDFLTTDKSGEVKEDDLMMAS